MEPNDANEFKILCVVSGAILCISIRQAMFYLLQCPHAKKASFLGKFYMIRPILLRGIFRLLQDAIINLTFLYSLSDKINFILRSQGLLRPATLLFEF